MKKIDKHEFLPSAVEIVERPPSPLGSFIIWTVFFFLLAGIIWSVVGRIDVVATARGRIVPEGRLKAVQPLEEGIIKEVFIEEGEVVESGQLLIEFDSTIKEADTVAIRKTLHLYRLEKQLMEAESEEKTLSIDKLFADYPELGKSKITSEYNYYLSREDEFRGDSEEIRLAIIQGKSQLDIAKSNLLKTQKQMAFLITEEGNYRLLKEIGGIKENDWLSKRSELDIVKQELNTRKYEIESVRTEVLELKKKLENIKLKRRSEISDRLMKLEKDILSLEGELIKGIKGFSLKKLYSPVDGRINEVRVSTVGGVVKPGESVVTIVPEDTPLIIKLLVLNKDIGFVEKGQGVEIKLDAFPFQKHGTLKGMVEKISPDAFEDERVGMVYKVSVIIAENNVLKGQDVISLVSGMSLTGEIKTGRRRIIEFFLSPLMKYTDESLKVR